MNNEKRISASIMCSDLLNVQRDVDVLRENGVDFLHIDIMDGAFVPNITLGIDLCNALGEKGGVKRDIHLLVENPTIFINRLNLKPGEMVSVHYEADVNVRILSSMIRGKGARFGLALNPETPISVLSDYLDQLDFVLLMMIKPGFAGLKKEAGMIEKIKDLRNYLIAEGKDLEIEVDGNVSFKNAREMSAASADIFVGGSSSIFSKKDDIGNCVRLLRKSITLA